MQFLRRHKYILWSLGIYWPLLFVLTHIPVPDIARQSGMSDKSMHALAYLALAFFVWLAISPYEKVRFSHLKVWLVLSGILCYAAFDEWSQSYVGRGLELMDFLGNLAGALLAFVILSILSFWPALLVVSAIFIFAVSNYSALLHLYPHLHLNTAFYFTAYTTLTLLWIQHLDRLSQFRHRHPIWPLMATSLPLGLLAVVKLAGWLYYNRPLWWVDIATAVFGIAATALISWITFFFAAKPKKTS